MTACAVANSAVMWSNSSPTNGSHDGSEAFCWVKIPSIITMPAIARTMIAIVSLRWPRAWRESQARKCFQRLTFGLALGHGFTPATEGVGAPTWPSGPLTSGTGLRVAADVRLQRRLPAELRLDAERGGDRVGVVDLVAVGGLDCPSGSVRRPGLAPPPAWART